MSNTPDYSQWPQAQDIQDIFDSVGVTPRNARRIVPILNAVIAEVGQRTQRQFVADTVDQTKTYDGSGTAEQEVDEIVSLTSVVVIGWSEAPGYTLDNVQVIKEQQKPQTRLVVSSGSLPALTTSGVVLPFRLRFPSGRQNIQVTGKFGYGALIPLDLWNDVAGEVAFRLLKESVYQQSGQIIDRMAGDEREKYALNHPEIIGAHDRFEICMNKTYKRPQGRRLRNLRPKMI